MPPQQAAAIFAVLSMAAWLPVYAALPRRAILTAPPSELVVPAIVQGGLIGAVSILVYTSAVNRLGPATTALFTAAVPGVTTLAAWPLLGERPGAASLAGAGIVTLGIVMGRGRPSAGPTVLRPGPLPATAASRGG